mmetsp:Transcript_7088/g.10536  ORF Transcript_7088/g.10536 Transcript_7088/m.10536 type:complete len:361 (-) Transcript_7088:904-1986(-)
MSDNPSLSSSNTLAVARDPMLPFLEVPRGSKEANRLGFLSPASTGGSEQACPFLSFAGPNKVADEPGALLGRVLRCLFTGSSSSSKLSNICSESSAKSSAHESESESFFTWPPLFFECRMGIPEALRVAGTSCELQTSAGCCWTGSPSSECLSRRVCCSLRDRRTGCPLPRWIGGSSESLFPFCRAAFSPAALFLRDFLGFSSAVWSSTDHWSPAYGILGPLALPGVEVWSFATETRGMLPTSNFLAMFCSCCEMNSSLCCSRASSARWWYSNLSRASRLTATIFSRLSSVSSSFSFSLRLSNSSITSAFSSSFFLSNDSLYFATLARVFSFNSLTFNSFASIVALRSASFSCSISNFFL